MQALPGIGKVEYEAQRDVFSLKYEPGRVRLEDIFAAVVQAGRRIGQEYWPRLLDESV